MNTATRSAKIGFALALALASIASPAWAAWDNGGLNVVKFDSTNPLKVIYKDQVRSQEQSFAYDRNTFNTNNSKSTAWTSPKPSNWTPGSNYKIEKMAYSWVSTDPNYVYMSNSVSSAPAKCFANSTNCGQSSHTVSAGTCIYRQVRVGVSNIPIAKVGTAMVDYSSGWATCNSQTSGIVCPAGNNLSYTNYTYGTIETQGVWANAKLTPDDGTANWIVDTVAQRDAWRNSCTSVGGTFSFTGGVDVPWYDVKCSGIKNRVTANSYGLYPSLTVPQISTCRVTK